MTECIGLSVISCQIILLLSVKTKMEPGIPRFHIHQSSNNCRPTLKEGLILYYKLLLTTGEKNTVVLFKLDNHHHYIR